MTDISLADSTATATSTIRSYSWNRRAITYRVEITPTTSGNVVINVPAAVATDALGNENTAATQETVTVDTGIPSVSITTGSVGENGVFDIVITFSEAVSGFVQEDLHLYGSANPSITAWTTKMILSSPLLSPRHRMGGSGVMCQQMSLRMLIITQTVPLGCTIEMRIHQP